MPNITGTNNGENLNDAAGDNLINALEGDGAITVVDGRDEVHGGAGIDTLVLLNRIVSFDGIGRAGKATGATNLALRSGGEPIMAAAQEFEFDYLDIDAGFDPSAPGSVFSGVAQRLRVSDTDDDLLEVQDNAETTALNDPVPEGTSGFETGETVAYFATLTTTFEDGSVVTFLALSNFGGSGVQGFAVLSGKVPIGVAVSSATYDTPPPSVPYSSLQGFASANTAPAAIDDMLGAVEDTPVTYTAAQLTGNDTDSDGDALTIASVTAVSGGTVVLNGDGTVTFTPDADFNGGAAFDYVVSDGQGGTDTGRATVAVAAVNDAPSGTDGAIAATEDTIYTFTAANFGFTDPVEGNQLAFVVITSLPDPAIGTLFFDFNGPTTTPGPIAVTVGQAIPVAGINAGDFSFVPAPNVNGAGAASFEFQVRDNGGIANGGQDTDQSANTLQINIAAVNDAPVITGFGPTLTVDEQSAPVLLDFDVSFTDVEENVAGGTLTLSGLDGDDRVAIRNEGTAPGDIGVSGTNVTFGGVVIGTFTGGSGATLTVALNSSATVEAVDALIENLTFANVSDAPVAQRLLTLNVIDAAGGTLFTNSDSTFTPLNGAANPFNGLNVGAFSSPNFVDFDGDGDLDVVTGGGGPQIRAFRNDDGATTFTELTGTDFPIPGVGGAGLVFPGFVDLDEDGDLDAVFGGNSNVLRSFRNEDNSTAYTELTGADDPFAAFPRQFVNAPAFVDIDGDGDQDAVFGGNNGELAFFRNENGSSVFTRLTGAENPFNGIDTGTSANAHSFPAFVDLDQDGDMDLLIGTSGGVVQAYRNNGSSFSQLSGTDNPFNSLVVAGFPFPAFGDLDDDGDMDALFGDGTGQILAFQNNRAPIVQVNVTPVNDNPILDLNGASAGVDANNGAYEQDPTGTGALAFDAVISDVDSPDFDGGTLTVEIGANAQAGDTLFVQNYTDGGGNIVVISGNEISCNGTVVATFAGGGDHVTPLVITFDADATAAAAQYVARAVSFGHTSDSPNAAVRTVTYTLTDGDGGSATANATVNVTRDNDAPALTVPTDATISWTEGAAPVALMQGVVLSDPDLPASFAGGSVTLNVTGGEGGLNLRSGTSFVINEGPPGTFNLAFQEGMTQIGIGQISGVGTQTVTISGLQAGATLARLNDLIDDFTFFIFGDDPAAGDRTVTLTFNDGNNTGVAPFSTALEAQRTQTLNVVAVDDAPVAQADAFAIEDDGSITGGNLFADNGSGADSDPDGPALAISAVNGSGANVGSQFMLASGALLTVNVNGTFDYDPNGAFLSTPTPGSGASNTPGQDSFSYTLAGGNTVTVTISLTGLDTDDILLGTAGSDVLTGGNGNDIYYVENGADQVIELNGGGNDRVIASVSYVLGASTSVETLQAAVGLSPINLTGNGLANTLIGNDGANVLHGGGGVGDVLSGLGGNDLYYTDVASTQIVEVAGGGTDTLYTSVSYVLGGNAQVENLSTNSHAATSAINLTGNHFAQAIFGNAGANIINGGGGADQLVGFGGNDTYYVDLASVKVYENAGGGNDTVYTSVSYALLAGQEIELLSTNSHAATSAINLTGNNFAQAIFGNAGANIINGGGGADQLIGFGGNDTYYVDLASVKVYEDAGGGNDAVYTSVSYALLAGQQIEFLSANSHAATSAINLTGNELANTLYGNAGANVLDGKGGSDALVGLAGADTFAFTTALGAGNVDIVFGFEHGVDRIALDDAIFTALGAPGALDPNAFVTGSAAADADDRIIYNSLTGQLFYDADGNGAGAAVQFATMSPGLTITASDFMVI